MPPIPNWVTSSRPRNILATLLVAVLPILSAGEPPAGQEIRQTTVAALTSLVSASATVGSPVNSEPPSLERDLINKARLTRLMGLAYVDESGGQVTQEEIRSFLSRQRSPLESYADAIVLAGNRHGVDPRLVVAIAGVESSFGKKCPGYNAWGWDGGRARWGSWEQSIDDFTRQLVEKYPNWRNIRRVAPRYNPNTPEAWGRKVKYLMASIDPIALNG